MSPDSSGLEEGATPEKFRFWFYQRLKAKRNEPKNQQRSKPKGTQAKTEREWLSIPESSSLREHYSWIYSGAWNAMAFFLTGKTWSVGFKNLQARECFTATVGWLKSSSFSAPFTCYTFRHWAFVWHREVWGTTPLNFGSFHLKVWGLASSCISAVQFPLVNFNSEHLHGTMTLELPRFAPPFLTSRVFVKAKIRYACWCEAPQVHEQAQKATLGPRLWYTMKQS